MTISRMQQSRQMYGLGSLVKKAVKGVTKGIKKFAKSDLGKVALLAGGAYFAPTLFGKSAGFGNFGSMLKSGIGSLGSKIMGGGALPPTQGLGKSKGLLGMAKDFLGGEKTLGKTLGVMGGGTLLGGLLAKAEEGDEDAVAATRNVDALKSYLFSGYKNLGYTDGQAQELTNKDTAEYTSGQGGYATGGRVKFGSGSEDYGDLIDAYERGIDVMPGESLTDYINRIRESERKKSAMGGRIGYAFGTPEQNAIQAAGIMNLPLNQNPAGVTELDLRETGGFIPPVGVKEKADDIPAMLANNEFVFTADAVRGMGEGNVNKGAQRMYDMMKKLEKGGRV